MQRSCALTGRGYRRWPTPDRVTRSPVQRGLRTLCFPSPFSCTSMPPMATRKKHLPASSPAEERSQMDRLIDTVESIAMQIGLDPTFLPPAGKYSCSLTTQMKLPEQFCQLQIIVQIEFHEEALSLLICF